MIDVTLLRFVGVGLANTAVGYVAILLLHAMFGFAPVAANIGGYLIGGLTSYVLHRSFTFRSSVAHGRALPRFAAAVAVSYLVNLLALEVALHAVRLPVAAAQAVAVALYTLTFYVVSRTFVFRDGTAVGKRMSP